VAQTTSNPAPDAPGLERDEPTTLPPSVIWDDEENKRPSSSVPDEPDAAAPPREQTHGHEPPTSQEVAKAAFPSVVLLVMQDPGGEAVCVGSGFILREGLVATSLHVVESAARGYAQLVGQKSQHTVAGIAGTDVEHDLVLLSIPGLKGPPLRLGESERVSVGDEVYVIGNPMGLEGTFSKGIVSGVRHVAGDVLLQLTAPISVGSSGGPVLDSYGRVIGVATAFAVEGQNLNFAVPASRLLPLLAGAKKSSPLRTAAASMNGFPTWREDETLAEFLARVPGERERQRERHLRLFGPRAAPDAFELDQTHRVFAGLPGVEVLVSVNEDAREAGISERALRTDVELLLRGYGVRVLTEEEALDARGYPSLHVYVNATPTSLPSYACAIHVRLFESAYLDRPPPAESRRVPVWETASYGYGGSDLFADAVRECVTDKVKEFVNAYLAANSK